MSLRRVRLSVESLEDRTTPATVSDLFNYAYQTNSNAWLLNQLNHDPMRLANPAIRPQVQALFTTVYQQATTTTQLLNQFPGALPPGVFNMVAYEAAWEASSALWVANVLGFSVTPAPVPTTPPVTGPASPATSSVSINPTSVAVNGTVAVLLTAKNAAGTPLTSGGAVVTFGLGSGTAQGTFTTVTDNHDGTYSATFTATVAGTNTITATIGGQAVTTTAPTLTVNAATTQPSPSKSTISIAAPSVPSGGSTTVTLTAKDANGTPLTTGGASVLFSLGTPTGGGTGTFGGVTDHGDGTYTASFTGGTPGVNTITATINTQPVTTTAPSVTIVGAADPSKSTVTVSPASIATTGTATVTLTAKDALGNQEVTGGSNVVFSLGTGTATGAFSSVVDHGDGTYTATFTPSAAGDNTITATIDSQALTSPAAPITVTNAGPGPVDLAQSVVTVAQSSVAVNGTTTVTLTAKDASGTQLTTGGLTVAFGLGSGAGQGTFTNLVDHGDGTYTATFTGTTAGDNTITATIGTQPVTSTAPGMTVTAAPGPIDPAHSTVAISPASVGINGTATVTLTAKDANGVALTAGGATVAFGLGSGAGQGDFTNLVDHGDGTYTATFTGTTAGTNTITATINTQPVTTTAPAVTVIGPADPAQSTVTINPSSIATNGTATVTLTAKDANGVQLTTGGATVDFSVGSGVGQGTFTNFVDHGDGTYTATFTGTTAGDNTIVVTLNTQAVTSSPTFTVT